MKFKAKFFDELTVGELYEIVRARCDIFLLEQKIICQDFDGVDLDSMHCFLECDSKVMAYLRAYRDASGVHIGRVLSITHGIGLGTRLMQEAIPEIRRRMGCSTITLHAQKHAEEFYKRLGFVTTSDVFLEEGIEHITMEIKLN